MRATRRVLRGVGTVCLHALSPFPQRNYILHHRATAAGATAPKASDYSEDDPYASAATALFGCESCTLCELVLSPLQSLAGLRTLEGLAVRGASVSPWVAHAAAAVLLSSPQWQVAQTALTSRLSLLPPGSTARW